MRVLWGNGKYISRRCSTETTTSKSIKLPGNLLGWLPNRGSCVDIQTARGGGGGDQKKEKKFPPNLGGGKESNRGGRN